MTLILTLGFDPDSFARLDGLRDAHFPPARNFISAHLTLFQQLPDDAGGRIAKDLRTLAQQTAPLPFTADRILDFGGGAALHLAMDGFDPLHRHLRHAWSAILTKSDDRRRQPHVTVQNKVDRLTAKRTLAALHAGFSPWSGVADRLLLWQYRGGPWDAVARYDLKGPPP